MREVSCARPGCERTFGRSIRNYVLFRRELTREGWQVWGSVLGIVHYCPEHRRSASDEEQGSVG